MEKQIEHDGYVWDFSYTDEHGNNVYERVIEKTPQAVVKTFFTEYNFEDGEKNPFKSENISDFKTETR